MRPDVVVVGGGIAGLVAARDLLLAGADVHVFEASDRLGGQVSSHVIGGVRLDAAAESFALRDSTVTDLVTELGREHDIVFPQHGPAWLIGADGAASALPATGLLGVPADPAEPDVAEVLGTDAVARALLDRDLAPRIGADATSFGALVRARMGDAVVTRLVAPITRGVHSKDPDALAVETAHPRLRELLARHGSLSAAIREIRASAPAGSTVASLRGGMHTLVTSLADTVRDLGGRISTGTSAQILGPNAVSLSEGDVRAIVLRAHAPSRAVARPIKLATLLVAGGDALDAAPRGPGALVTSGAPGVVARALTHVTSKWEWAATALDGRHVLRLSYDADILDPAAHAFADADRILGASVTALAEPVVTTWHRYGRTTAGDVPGVGESIAGTGLAATVAHARRTARGIMNSTDPTRYEDVTAR